MTQPGPLTSYAQNFEDVILWRALKQIEGGFYIDIGAQDPVEDSVSLGFYEKGWRGVHVEPTLHYAAKLREARPDETVIQAAIAAEPGLLHFFEVVETGLSTGDPQQAEIHRKSGFTIRESDVPSMTLAALLGTYAGRDIHWLKIDVEGLEAQIVESWGDSPVRPWVVVLESVLPGTMIDCHQRWECRLLDKGYRFVHFDGVNRFYLAESRGDLEDRFRSGPNCFDDFVLSGAATHRFCKLLLDKIAITQEKLDALHQETSFTIAELTRDLSHARKESLAFKASLEETHRSHVESVQSAQLAARALEEQIAAQRDVIATQRDEIAVQRDEIAARQDEIAVQRDEIAARQDEIARLNWEIADRDLRIAQIHASWSWRLTKPVRGLSRAARRVKRALFSIPAAFHRHPEEAPTALPSPPPPEPSSARTLPAAARRQRQRLLANRRDEK